MRQNFKLKSKDFPNLKIFSDTIMSSRQSLYDRHALHKLNVAGVSRLIDEYNQLMSKLSPSEVGLFRSKILTLDKKIWNGIYKYSWGEQSVSLLFTSKKSNK